MRLATRFATTLTGVALAVTLTPPPAVAFGPGPVTLAAGTLAVPGVATNAFTYDAMAPAGARVAVRSVSLLGHTQVVLTVRGLLPHHQYGAHVHRNACGPTGADAGPHYQRVPDPVQPSVDPTYANPRNEVWLDLTTDARGNGRAVALQRWRFTDPRPGSVVIHAQHTSHHDGTAGTAGARLACLTVHF